MFSGSFEKLPDAFRGPVTPSGQLYVGNIYGVAVVWGLGLGDESIGGHWFGKIIQESSERCFFPGLFFGIIGVPDQICSLSGCFPE